MPVDAKLESRPRAPVLFDQYKRQAENMAKVFGLARGAEHVKERLNYLESPRTAREKNDASFPAKFVYALWEEL